MMRALVVSNVLARREDTILYVAVQPGHAGGRLRSVDTLTRVHQLATVVGIL
jgi:hypothetical protein